MRPSETVSILMCCRNEARHVDGALLSVLALTTTLMIEMHIVANNCTDDTVEKAEKWSEQFEQRGWLLHVHSPNISGKPAAIRFGNAAIGHGPVLLLDARVRIAPDALDILHAAANARPDALLSAQLTYASSPSRLVSAFSRAYSRSPYALSEDLKGTCVYFGPLQRWLLGSILDVGADDRHFLSQMQRSKRAAVSDATCVYTFPETFGALLRQQIRWAQTNHAVDDMAGQYERSAHEAERWPYFASPRPDVFAVAVFTLVAIYTRAYARVRPSTKPSW